jgi:hypothetical protein
MSDNLPELVELDVEAATNAPTLASMRSDLTAAAEPIRTALLTADTAIHDAIAKGDLEQIAYLLRGIRLIKSAFLRPIVDDIAVLDRSAEDACAGMMPDSRTMTDVGLLHRRKSGGSTTWSGRDLLQRLACDVVDPDTGERFAAIPLTVALEVLPQASAPSASWRISGLRNVGIDPDEWKFTIGDRYTVTIVEEGHA